MYFSYHAAYIVTYNLVKIIYSLRACSFLTKAKNAEDAGAVGVLIADNDFNNDRVSINMIKDDTDRKVNIPAGFMLATDR